MLFVYIVHVTKFFSTMSYYYIVNATEILILPTKKISKYTDKGIFQFKKHYWLLAIPELIYL